MRASLARRSLLAALLASPGAGWAADDDGSAEYQVKAAFVCKFGTYVDWPAPVLAAAAEPFRIGVLASNAVAEEFRRVAAAAVSVAGHPVEVKRLARGEATDGLHVVFVSRAMSAHAGEVMAALHGRPVLTVTELDPGGTTGMINFVVVDDKVRFDILLPPATQSGLKISVRLLGVARRVEGRS
jgi:hypothetical protein